MTRPVRKRSAVQRTVVMLTERLDHHRDRGQQQITVKHVTVNADQAIVGNVKHHPGRSELQAKERPMQLPTRHRPGQVKEAFDRRRLAIGQRETAAQIVKVKNAIEGSSGSAGARQANISAPFMKVGPLPAAITHCPQ